MRALTYEQYGESNKVLQITDVPKPTAVNPHDVVIHVHSAAVNPIDWKMSTGLAKALIDTKPSPEKPVQVGFDVSGIIVQVGSEVTKFQKGDAVFGMAPWDGYGTIAEYFLIQDDLLAKKPSNISHDHAAALALVGLTSYQGLFEHGKLQQDDKILILNGSGGAGSVAIQLAHANEAYVITTTSLKNTSYVKSLGADQVIDYTTTSFQDVIEPHSLDVVYDAIYGTPEAKENALKVLKPTGRYINIVPGGDFTFIVQPNGKDLDKIQEYMTKGLLTTSIDSVFTLEESVQALERSQTGRSRGKVVIKVQ